LEGERKGRGKGGSRIQEGKEEEKKGFGREEE
jgi:hypothetical protein